MCCGCEIVIDFLMMPNGKVVQIRTWSNMASPRCVGQNVASPWMVSRGPRCMIQARAEAMSFGQAEASSSDGARSSMCKPKAGRKGLVFVTE